MMNGFPLHNTTSIDVQTNIPIVLEMITEY